MGTVSALYPEGIKEVTDLPHTLFSAIRLGLNYLAFEELPEDEQPPKRIWTNPEKLKDWFVHVKKLRERKYGSGGDGPGEIEDPVENAAAHGLIVGSN